MIKKRKIVILMIMVLIVGMLSGCSKQSKNEAKQPDIDQVRNICKLATLQCYYHNVAKSEKTADGLFEKDRKFWIEYTGIVNLGIDMSKVKMELNGTNLEITIPSAEVLGISIEQESFNEDSFMSTDDGWLIKNKITAEDQTEAIEKAQKNMEITVKENSSLLLSAQTRAKTLIENYIKQLGEAAGIEYHIKWIYI